jgi:hypothetical protein
MKNETIEFKKWNQIYLPSQPGTSEIIPGHALSEWLFNRVVLVRCIQILGAVLLSCGLYFLNLWTGDGMRLLVAMSAVSAFLYIGLALQSRTKSLALLNLLAIPILFATACTGLNAASAWLIASFILHGSLSAVQLSTVNQDLRGGLLCWSVFNSAMALLLLLG